ncbi:MAG: outer membrane protein transport protein [Planctomycetota bacterium]|jgi:long-subunit fatty acid transport protein|nr:outer membrane protein transport protein [Planctomycetota bacterium]
MRLLPLCLLLPLPLWSADPILEPPTSAPGNYSRLATGHFGAVEEGAVIARGFGPEAAWFNPAGLAHEHRTTLSGNASLFERVDMEVSGDSSSTPSSALGMYPVFVGNSFPLVEPEEGRPWVLGLALVTTESWNQKVSLDVEVDEGGGLSRTVSFDNSSEVTGLVPTVALGVQWNEHWSFGANLRVQYSSYEVLANGSQRVLDADRAPVFSQSSNSSLDLSVWQASAGLGVQYRPTEHWRFGLMANTPSWQIAGDGDAKFDLFFSTQAVIADGRLRANDFDVEVKQPWSVGIGAAYVAESWEFESDLLVFGDPGSYSLFEYDSDLVLTVRETGSGNVTTVNEAIPAATSNSQATYIASLGGRFHLNERYALHGGMSYNRSPTDSSSGENAFRDVDLWSLSLGASRSTDAVSTVLGGRVSWGEDRDILVEDLIGDDQQLASLEYLILSLTFSTAYRF